MNPRLYRVLKGTNTDISSQYIFIFTFVPGPTNVMGRPAQHCDWSDLLPHIV